MRFFFFRWNYLESFEQGFEQIISFTYKCHIRRSNQERIVKLKLTRWSSVDPPRSGPTLAAFIHFLFCFASPTQIFSCHAILLMKKMKEN